jgi:hypothetical protein
MAQIVPLVRQPRSSAGVVPSPDLRAGTCSPQVYILFTSVDDTLRAVRAAVPLARAMNRGVAIVHFRAIAFGEPLDAPTGVSPIETDSFRARLNAEVPGAHRRVWPCRDPRVAMSTAFAWDSLIVMAGRRRWWPTREDRWRQTLEALGHTVVFVNGATRA